MKKLLTISLLSSALMANASFKEDLQDVGSQFAEVVLVPARAIKNVIVENEIDQDFVYVISAYPQFFVEQAQEVTAFTKETTDKIANSKFAANLKKANDKVVDSTKAFGSKVKNVTTQATDAVKSAATKVAHSQAVEDLKDVGAQFASAPFEFWAAVKATAQTVKNEIW